MNDDGRRAFTDWPAWWPGIAISWPTIFDRLRLARQGAPEIGVWSMASFLVGPLIVVGLVMLSLGARTEPLMRDAERQRMRPFGNIVALACVVAGFAGMLGTSALLRSYGYR